MKPRQDSAPLTDEDYEIWYGIDVRWSAMHPPCLRSHWSDRRDAELIYVYEKAKTLLIEKRGVAAYVEIRYWARTMAIMKPPNV